MTLQKPHFLLLAALFGAASAPETSGVQKAAFVPLSQRPLLQIPAPSAWEKEIAAFEIADKKRFPAPGAVLFIGSSSIRGWRSLETDFPGLSTLNRGFGGSQISDSTEFAPRIVWPYAPSKIVFYAGTNDIQAGKSPQRVFEDWQKFVAVARQKRPATPILFLSIVESPARLQNVEKVRAANALIRDWNATQTELGFLDVSTPLQNPGGQMRLELFQKDRLHLTSAGYAVWTRTLASLLASPLLASPTPKP